MPQTPPNSPRDLPDATPNPEDDSDDQRSLRAFGRELAAQIQDAGAGGVVLMSSMESNSWTFALPTWSGLQMDPATGQMRLRLSSKTAEGRAQADATLGMLTGMRDLAGECARVFDNLYRQAEAALKAQGATIDHKPIGSPGARGPTGKIKS